jgi:serine/threonine protein kinase
LEYSKKFTSIASHPHHSFSFALSENGIYHVWGSIGGKVINEPEKIEVESFQDAFASYLQITESAIHFKHKEILVPNGKYSEYFKEISLLGKGSYGIVWRVKFLPDGKFFAVKKILAKDENVQDQAKELATSIWFLELRSEFIVNYYDVWYENNPDVNGKYNTGKSTIFIQMDLCEKTLKTLKNELHGDSNFKISKPDKLTKLGYFIFCELFIEILEGVKYLHGQNIIHRDLKLDNILIHNGRNNTFVKIADFGLAKGLQIGGSNTIDRGTPGYMAPEVLKSSKYDIKADIYSLGVIFEDLLCIDLNE